MTPNQQAALALLGIFAIAGAIFLSQQAEVWAARVRREGRGMAR